MMASLPDLDALLVALVLAPATYSRNRFFELYKDPAARRVRRRASLVRSIIRHLTKGGGRDPGSITGSTTTPSGRVELTYEVPALGLRRVSTLEPIEASLIRYAMARAASDAAKDAPPPEDQPDRARIEAALRRLGPFDAPSPAAPETHAPAPPQEPIG